MTIAALCFLQQLLKKKKSMEIFHAIGLWIMNIAVIKTIIRQYELGGHTTPRQGLRWALGLLH